MCYPIGARLAQRCLLALDTLYHHLFSTPGRDSTTIDQLMTEFRQPLQVKSHIEMSGILVQLGHIQRT